MIIVQAQPYKGKVIALLAAEKLPVEDLPVSLVDFIVAIENTAIIGAAGLEIYGKTGLLRSLVVSPEHRNRGIAGKLLQRIEAIAALKLVTELYLLTETAPNYFEQKGYRKIIRSEVPTEVQASSEVSHVCPVSAVVMKKTLK